MDETTTLSIEQLSANILLISIFGDLDSMGTHQIEDSFANAVNDRAGLFVVDLANVGFVSSAGMAMLLVRGKALKQGGGRMVISGANQRVKDSLALAGFDELFKFFKSIAEAEKALQ